MRKNIKVRVICLVIAGVMLTGSLAVAAVNGSPYEVLKNALFNVGSHDNITIDMQMSITFNGEAYETERTRMVITETGSLEYFFDSYGQPTGGFAYSADNVRIRSDVFVGPDGTQWYSAWSSSWNLNHSNHYNPFWLTPEDRNSAQFRFIELLIDLFVGDLRNNMSMTSSGGVRSVTGTISHNQLPEIIRAGIDMIIEQEQRWLAMGPEDRRREDFRHPMHIPPQSVHFNRIHGDADIDADGNLLYLHGHIDVTLTNIFGDVNNSEMIFEFNFTDIGTSVAENPIYGAAQLLTSDFFEQEFNRRYGLTVYFTRNADGSINEDSVTTTWPGQRH
jgi:hypothetical protein